jgi:hypothetical protein
MRADKLKEDFDSRTPLNSELEESFFDAEAGIRSANTGVAAIKASPQISDVILMFMWFLPWS